MGGDIAQVAAEAIARHDMPQRPAAGFVDGNLSFHRSLLVLHRA